MDAEITKQEGAAVVAAPEAKPAKYTVTDDGGRKRDLVKPIVGHAGAITSITLRKPKYRDVMTYGDPETLVIVDGGYVPQVDMALIEKYIVTLSGVDALLLEQMDYRDALALRDAVRSFFQ